ncbi:Arc family DNA-binding protein [Neptuniibacter sp.]|uniref:Arc family DNA-binding protein n=1 Tax=Neptuniibacter sp. TaxID=1962643 RepID=UPI002606095F|nr:Arc family DNA-binding protein [Neptuniibacter sp.]MCP4595764.1 Arc family DNA-binding protein [Neptuniibacter sp.]
MGTNKLQSYPLRMEQELRQHLEKAAEESGRSLNAEIIFRLNQSIAEPRKNGKGVTAAYYLMRAAKIIEASENSDNETKSAAIEICNTFETDDEKS